MPLTKHMFIGERTQTEYTTVWPYHLNLTDVKIDSYERNYLGEIANPDFERNRNFYAADPLGFSSVDLEADMLNRWERYKLKSLGNPTQPVLILTYMECKRRACHFRFQVSKADDNLDGVMIHEILQEAFLIASHEDEIITGCFTPFDWTEVTLWKRSKAEEQQR